MLEDRTKQAPLLVFKYYAHAQYRHTREWGEGLRHGFCGESLATRDYGTALLRNLTQRNSSHGQTTRTFNAGYCSNVLDVQM